MGFTQEEYEKFLKNLAADALPPKKKRIRVKPEALLRVKPRQIPYAVVLPCIPKPKQRHRVNPKKFKKGLAQGKNVGQAIHASLYGPTAEHEKQIALVLKHAKNVQEPLSGPVGLQIVIDVQKNETAITVESLACAQKLDAGGDLDNIVKTVMDALQKAGVYQNDRQVKKIEVEIK